MTVFQPDCLMLNAHFVECTHLRNVALSSWLSSSFLCNEFAQCSFLIGDVNCSTSGTFATLYSAAWVFRYKFWLLSPWTGFRKLHGYGFHKNFGEDRGSRLGKKVLFSDCNLQGLQLAALIWMRPGVLPHGPCLPAERLLCKPEQLLYLQSYTYTINLVTRLHCFQ